MGVDSIEYLVRIELRECQCWVLNGNSVISAIYTNLLLNVCNPPQFDGIFA